MTDADDSVRYAALGDGAATTLAPDPTIAATDDPRPIAEGIIMRYDSFLASKTPRAHATGIDPGPMNPALFDYQMASVAFCLRMGRAALFLDTGLGKTLCELEFAHQAMAASNGYALILTPLAVAKQTEREAVKFGYDARVVRDQSDVAPGINICNYDRLDKIDTSAFAVVVLDESSILKNFSGKTTRLLIETFRDAPFRLCATATPAPNDYIEIGTHAEFLGVMTQAEMLVRWFINDTNDTGNWRLKNHARIAFWDWMASWAVMAESPEDMGFDGSRFILPPLQIHKHKAESGIMPQDGLFGFNVSATKVHALKRETAVSRADAVRAIVDTDMDSPWLIWCDTNSEADELVKVLPSAVDVRGAHSVEFKEGAVMAFVDGCERVLISKPSIMGMGMNFQHCRNMVFTGRSFSYESWYQAVRRCWRFGQTMLVNVHLIVAEGEDEIGRVIDRKADAHAAMKAEMRAATRRNIGTESATKVPYNPTFTGRLPSWM